MARLAEQAYPCRATGSTGQHRSPATTGTPRTPDCSAGERLLLDLQRLERQYIERNDRKLEIEQASRSPASRPTP